jgi:hypothetical protein
MADLPHVGARWPMACLADRVRQCVTGVVFFAVALCVSGKAYAAGTAYQVDTAEVSSVGSCKVESWVSSADNRNFIGAVMPACVVDLFRAVELSSQFNRSRSDDEWTTAATPKFKTNLIPSAIGRWGVAFTATMSYNFITRETTAYNVTIPATLRLSDTVRINVNAGWQLDRTVNQNYFTYGLGFDWRTPDNVWTLTGEVFGQRGAAETSSQVAPRFQLGLRYRPVDRFNIDLIYGRNIAGENANWITLATTSRFSVGGDKK